MWLLATVTFVLHVCLIWLWFPVWNIDGANAELSLTCIISNGQQGTTTLVSKRGRIVKLMRKMTLPLTWFITLVNCFLISVLLVSCILQYNMPFSLEIMFQFRVKWMIRQGSVKGVATFGFTSYHCGVFSYFQSRPIRISSQLHLNHWHLLLFIEHVIDKQWLY